MKKISSNCVKIFLSVTMVLTTLNLFACTIIAVGKKASADGSVIISPDHS